MPGYYFHLVNGERVIDSMGRPVADRDQAIAIARRLAIDLAAERQECLGGGYSVSVTDGAAHEIHRESIDSAGKSG